MYENCDSSKFHDVTLTEMLGIVHSLLPIITKQLYFSYLEDILIRKTMILGQLASAADVVWEVSCWHKKIIIGLFAASAPTANKIRLNPI